MKISVGNIQVDVPISDLIVRAPLLDFAQNLFLFKCTKDYDAMKYDILNSYLSLINHYSRKTLYNIKTTYRITTLNISDSICYDTGHTCLSDIE